MSFGCRRAHRHQQIVRWDTETLPQPLIRAESREINILFDAGVSQNSGADHHQAIIRNHSGHHHPTWFDERYFRREFVVSQEHIGYSRRLVNMRVIRD